MSAFKVNRIIGICSVVLFVSVRASADDWPQWRGLTRDGIAVDHQSLSWPAAGPKLLWKSEFIPANLEGGFGSVSVADGKVNVFVSWKSGFKGSTEPQDVIACLDDANGKTLWMTGFPSVNTDHCSGSTPCVAGDKVFAFGSQRLYCVDAKTGRALWQSEESGQQISSSPLSADGVVFALSDALRAYDPNGGGLVDPSDPNGSRQPRLLWEQPAGAGGPRFEGVDHTSYNSSPAVWRKDGTTYIITCGDKLTCVDAKTGAVKWQAPGPGGASATPAISGDYVVINYGLGRGTYAYRMTPDKAEQLWRVSKSDRGSTPVIVDGYVYAYGGGSYACYDLVTGQEKWKQRFGGEISSPLAADGKIFGFYSGASAITVFRATSEKFDPLDNLQTAGVVASSPAIANGKLYLRKGNCVASYALTRDPNEQEVLPPLAVAAGKPLRILLGSARDWVDAKGNRWSADEFAQNGKPFTITADSDPTVDPPRIYRSGLKGLTGFPLHLVDGIYTVRAHFCETDEGIAEPGLRVMSLYVNGREAENIDPFGDTGGRGFPLVKQVTTTVKDGWLKINLVSQSGETMLNALEILPGERPKPAATERKPMAQSVAPATAPGQSGLPMQVGVIGIPIIRHQTTRVSANEWVSGLESASLAGDKISVHRIRSIEELMSALAHPEQWLGIINPYGEAFPIAGPTRWKETLAGIRQYVRHGGNWFETGGYPFFEGFFQEDGGASSARIMGEGMEFLELSVGKGPQKAPLERLAVTAIGKRILGEQVTAAVLNAPCEINRPLPETDGLLTLITAGDRGYMGGYSLGGWGRLWRIGGSRVSPELAIPVIAEILRYSYTHPPLCSSESSVPEISKHSLSVATMSNDWPQWRGPDRDGIARNSPPLSWSAVGPKERWRSEPLPSMEDGGFGSVTVADGKVFVFVDWKHGFQGDAGRQDVIVCLEEKTGRTLWKAGYPTGIRTDHAVSSVPCVANNRVFVCGVERLYCLNAESGELLWKTGVIGEQISSSPLFLDGMVLVSANSLFAYDAATGKELWRQDEAAGGPRFEGVPHTSNNTSPVVWRKNGVNYIINCGTKLTCVEAKTGAVKWQAPGPGGASASPAVHGDHVVINYGQGRGTYAYSMTPERAEERWRVTKCDRGSTPVILDGAVYAFGGGSYACYDLATGQERWKERFRGEISSPVAADGKVFGSYDDGAGIVVFKAAADQYSEIDRLAIRTCAASTPTIANGRLFARAYDGVVCYALTPADRDMPLPELAAPAGEPIRINAGGAAWTDPDGNSWMADRFADDGMTFEWGALPVQADGPRRIYQSERRDVTGYTLHVANGPYTVRAHFCENYEGIPEAGLRVMTLDINGAALRNVDPFGEAGARGVPLIRQVHTSVSNGLLKIDLLAREGETILNGLEILPGRLAEAEAIPAPAPRLRAKAPDTSPYERGIPMAVGIIDIQGLADHYGKIKPDDWIAGLRETGLTDYDIAVKRLTTVEQLVNALAHPEAWLAILNPYGEHFVAVGAGRWREMIASIRHYVRHGGNWWEMGGYPLYQSQFVKESDMLSERVLDKGFRFLGLEIGKAGDEGPVSITDEGSKVFNGKTASAITRFTASTSRGMPADGVHLTLLRAGDSDLLGGYPLGGWGWFWRFTASRPNAELYIPAVAAVLEHLYTRPPASLTLAAPVMEDGDFPSFEEMKRHWPCFRGVDGGAALSIKTNPPLRWDAQSGAAVLWKVPVPAPGNSSPIMWGDRVFLSGGDADNQTVYCFHATNGSLLWKRDLELPAPPGAGEWEVPEDAGMASSTMATDGRRAYAIFANGDLAAFDFDGNRVWARNLGLPDNFYGHTSSLALWGDRLIVQIDQGEEDENKSRLMAIDSATGRSIWEKHRPVDASWASPIVVEAAGKTQILALSTPWAIAYDALDGSELWRVGGIGGEVAPSPIFAGGLFFVISPYEAIYAISPDGQGDVTDSHVAWYSDEWVPDICCPVSNGELVFTLMTSGLLTCYDAQDGGKVWEHDLGMEFQASPSIVGDRLYLFAATGKVLVLDVSRTFKELARSDLGEAIYASPAFVEGRIYVRSVKNLFCLGEK